MPRLPLIVAMPVAAVDLLYLAVIRGKPSSQLAWRSPFVAVYLAAVAVCAVLCGGGSGFLTGSYTYTCQNGKTIVTDG